jgi:hypothetical protein
MASDETCVELAFVLALLALAGRMAAGFLANTSAGCDDEGRTGRPVCMGGGSRATMRPQKTPAIT